MKTQLIKLESCINNNNLLSDKIICEENYGKYKFNSKTSRVSLCLSTNYEEIKDFNKKIKIDFGFKHTQLLNALHLIHDTKSSKNKSCSNTDSENEFEEKLKIKNKTCNNNSDTDSENEFEEKLKIKNKIYNNNSDTNSENEFEEKLKIKNKTCNNSDTNSENEFEEKLKIKNKTCNNNLNTDSDDSECEILSKKNRNIILKNFIKKMEHKKSTTLKSINTSEDLTKEIIKNKKSEYSSKLRLNACLKVSTLKLDTFENFESLDSLEISFISIDEFELNIFDKLQNLKYLNIYNTKLGKISKELFSQLKSLEILELFNNSIKIIEPFAFNNLNNLKKLDLSSNDFKIINSDVFFGLSSLITLHILFNDLENIEEDTFKHLKNLIEIDLRFCDNYNIVISKNIFNKMPKLIRAAIGYTTYEDEDLRRSDVMSMDIKPSLGYLTPETNINKYLFELSNIPSYDIYFDT